MNLLLPLLLDLLLALLLLLPLLLDLLLALLLLLPLLLDLLLALLLLLPLLLDLLLALLLDLALTWLRLAGLGTQQSARKASAKVGPWCQATAVLLPAGRVAVGQAEDRRPVRQASAKVCLLFQARAVLSAAGRAEYQWPARLTLVEASLE